jgi:transketolase
MGIENATIQLKKELLEYSFKHNLAHIPSALSMFDYVWELFSKGLVKIDDKLIIGKPFGAQTYYIIWKHLGYLDDIDNLAVALKHEQVPFVTLSEETLGNSLGIAAGVAMTTDKLVWVNLTDATLQMGATLEAIQFIGHNNLKNILVTVDYNGSQVTGKTADIMPTDPVIDLFKGYGWEVYDNLNNFSIGNRPKVFIMKTKKGSGIPSMEQDTKKWHYRQIATLEELQSLEAELLDI